jgi:8-oxo-dGTP pyrophosphatase MutT (NUDIX family)
MEQLASAIPHVRGEHFTRFLPPAEGGRPSAVLVLFGEGPDGPDLLLIERAATLRSHAGQPAFPGGAQDPEDDGPIAAALREATEEVGLDAGTVEVLGILPALWLPPSGFVVHPVVAWWREPHPVDVVDEGEVAAVVRVPLSELTDPENRFRVVHPSGFTGPAFQVRGLMVWGFTAGLLAGILTLAGWERPWDSSRTRELDPDTVRLAARTWQNNRETS